MMSTRAVEYQEHLRSPEWQLLRDATMARAGGKCEHCGKPATQVHHVRYPKIFTNDHPDNLVAVCDGCHDLHHGAKPMTAPALTEWKSESIVSPSGDRITVLSKDGGLFADEATWLDGLRAPSPERAYLSSRISTQGALMQRPGFVFMAQVNGTRVFRWDVVDEALMFWYTVRSLEITAGKGDGTYRSRSDRERITEFRQSLFDMRFHFRRQQESVWVAKIQGKHAPQPPSAQPAWVEDLIRRLGDKAVEQERQITVHGEQIAGQETRVARIEAVTLRRRDEWITLKEACHELCIDEATVVHGRENVTAAAGRLLASHDRPRGPTRSTRLDGCGLMRPVNTWRREDAYKAICRVTGRNVPDVLVD